MRQVPADLVRLAQSLRDIFGVRRASELLGVSRHSLANILGSGLVMPGTIAILREAEKRVRDELRRAG